MLEEAAAAGRDECMSQDLVDGVLAAARELYLLTGGGA